MIKITRKAIDSVLEEIVREYERESRTRKNFFI